MIFYLDCPERPEQEPERGRMSRNEPSKRLQHYRRILRLKAAEVRSSLSAERAAEIVSRPEEPLDFGDWCQKSHEEWLYLNQNRLELALLREVEAALARVESGTYGFCQRCNAPIAARRLDAVPWAKHCVPCEERRGDGGEDND
jgi:DnaK suppressor protein